MDKKIYTREEFEIHLSNQAKKQSEDNDLSMKALEVLVNADKQDWIHQTRWFGEPALQTPEDMLILQDIIFRTKPDFFIEVGTAWSGSLLMYTIMHALGHGHIIGVDIFIPDDLVARINSFPALRSRLLINGSSIDPNVLEQVQNVVGSSQNVSVHLDSDHSHNHVLEELNLYSNFVSQGNYLICGDTVVDDIPTQTHRPRPWGIGNNPKTAMLSFVFFAECTSFYQICLYATRSYFLIRKMDTFGSFMIT